MRVLVRSSGIRRNEIFSGSSAMGTAHCCSTGIFSYAGPGDVTRVRRERDAIAIIMRRASECSNLPRTNERTFLRDMIFRR